MEKLLSDEEKFDLIKDNIKTIKDNVNEALVKSGRKDSVQILAVTKTVEPKFINYALSCGLDKIGENRVQEYYSKKDELNIEPQNVHLIGHLQSNKVKKIVGNVGMIESVDSLNIANCIGKYSTDIGITTDCLIEINIGNEFSKNGIDKNQLIELCHEISEIKGIKVRGIMSIPPICEEKSEIINYFSNMYNLFVDIRGKKIDNIAMDYLSMGMSGDYREAVLQGSNIIRPGRAIFGARHK